MRTTGCASKHLGVTGRQIRQLNLRCDGERFIAKYLIPHCQEKPLGRKLVPVPQTDTGR